MQPLFLCWMFDRRWLWGLRNPCAEFLLLVPTAFNVASISAMMVERVNVHVEMDACYLLLIILLMLLAVFTFILFLKTYLAAQSKLKGSHQNYVAIRQFRHTFEGKKNVWSWMGLLIALLSIVQIIINRLYLNINEPIYPCFTNKIKFYCDLGSWAYISLVILLFLVLKIGFLLLAWKSPEKYLRFKSVL